MTKYKFKPVGNNIHEKQWSIIQYIEDLFLNKKISEIITNGQVGTALQDTSVYLQVKFDTSTYTGKKYPVGMLVLNGDNINLSIDPQMRWDDKRILIDNIEIKIINTKNLI